MTKYREILRLASLGFSNRSIALSVPCSRNTVAKVLKMAQELKLCWPLQDNQTDEVLEKLFYPQLNNRPQKREPDYDYIRKELLRNGVSKKLLWTEYMEDCRANGDEPLMYSQFCYHIQQDEQKHRATMHINRKPGEQVEVDWAGDPATIIDPHQKKCLSPAKKYKLYKSSINKSIHFAQRRLSNSTRVQVQRVTAQLNLSRE